MMKRGRRGRRGKQKLLSILRPSSSWRRTAYNNHIILLSLSSESSSSRSGHCSLVSWIAFPFATLTFPNQIYSGLSHCNSIPFGPSLASSLNPRGLVTNSFVSFCISDPSRSQKCLSDTDRLGNHRRIDCTLATTGQDLTRYRGLPGNSDTGTRTRLVNGLVPCFLATSRTHFIVTQSSLAGGASSRPVRA